MNHYFLLISILLFFNFCNNTEIGEIIKLPEPKKVGGMGLYEALNKRRSSRDFVGKPEVTLETIGQALWSCYGYGEDGHRVVPAAKNWYPFIIYVFLEDGVYKYNPEDHDLLKLFNGDHRDLTGTQPSITSKAAVNMVFIADLTIPSKLDPNKDMKRLAALYDIGNPTMALSLFA